MAIDISGLGELYRDDNAAQVILDHFASRERNWSQTSVDRLQVNTATDGHPLSRGEVIAVFKRLEELGCGKFIVGRRGGASRFEWEYGMVDVGRAAAGEPAEPESISPEEKDSEEERLERMLDHRFRLRRDLVVSLSLPADLSQVEAGRVAEFVKTLPFE